MKRYWLATMLLVVSISLGACSIFENMPSDKRVYSTEDFEEIVCETGFGECQICEDPEDLDHVTSCCTSDEEGIRVCYYLFENVSHADQYFFDEKLALDMAGKGTTDTINNFMNYKIYSQESEEQYTYLIRVENAVLQIDATMDQKPAAEALLLALGY